MNVTIRKAFRCELEWLNARYDEVGFRHSDFNRELIAIAEVEGNKAGLGRLVTIDSNTAELGGMYVFTEYRGYGVAGKIVEFLLQHSGRFKQIFCLPFAYLKDFYGKYGFVPTDESQDIPALIREKHNWCKRTYEHEILLLVLAR